MSTVPANKEAAGFAGIQPWLAFRLRRSPMELLAPGLRYRSQVATMASKRRHRRTIYRCVRCGVANAATTSTRTARASARSGTTSRRHTAAWPPRVTASTCATGAPTGSPTLRPASPAASTETASRTGASRAHSSLDATERTWWRLGGTSMDAAASAGTFPSAAVPRRRATCFALCVAASSSARRRRTASRETRQPQWRLLDAARFPSRPLAARGSSGTLTSPICAPKGAAAASGRPSRAY